MKVLHVTRYCHVSSVGGTERYVRDLVSGLRTRGVICHILWLRAGGARSMVESDGIQISIIPSPAGRVDKPSDAFDEAAEQVLREFSPDWVHFHTFGLAERRLAELSREAGARCAFTYHSPAWTCRRETMLLYGASPCDGQVRAWRCAVCQGHGRLGGSHLLAVCVAAASLCMGKISSHLQGSLRRRLCVYGDTLELSKAVREFLGQCELVVSCCSWSTPVLHRNGARRETLVLCPQGVSSDFVVKETRAGLGSLSQQRQKFIIGFVGRLVDVKGPHIVMEAFCRVPGDDIELRLFGADRDLGGTQYARRLKVLAKADSRISIVCSNTLAAIRTVYGSLSLLTIPSIWMETGPLTLLEAAACGVPVYGSNRIGQIEQLREWGRIVEPNTTLAWREAIQEAVALFREGRWPPSSHVAKRRTVRTMDDVVDECMLWYRSGAQG